MRQFPISELLKQLADTNKAIRETCFGIQSATLDISDGSTPTQLQKDRLRGHTNRLIGLSNQLDEIIGIAPRER